MTLLIGLIIKYYIIFYKNERIFDLKNNNNKFRNGRTL